MGFTHIELLPITEHPFDGSWGYQPLGLFAPTARFGPPEGFARFVDALPSRRHRRDPRLGAGAFPDRRARPGALRRHRALRARRSARGLPPRLEHLIYNFGRREVQGFLIANALYWLEHFHVDGLRVDAVASMLYRDYSRKAGEWVPNVHGGRENLEAIAFLRALQRRRRRALPRRDDDRRGIDRLARRHRGRSANGGLGFGYKWNMGWMHDTLRYMEHDPIHRRYHHDDMTFGLLYAFSENFILPLSHDEVVHGKGSLIGKMPGDDWQTLRQPARLFRLHVGASRQEAAVHGRRDRPGARVEPRRASSTGTCSTIRAHRRRAAPGARPQPALSRASRRCIARDCEPRRLPLDRSATIAHNSVFAFLRYGDDGDPPVLVVCNLTPVPRHGYRIGVPRAGRWREIAQHRRAFYGGSDIGNDGRGRHAPVHARTASRSRSS